MKTGASNVTWLIDPKKYGWGEKHEGGCRISELDHYGVLTGDLWCAAHCEIVGEIVEPEKWD